MDPKEWRTEIALKSSPHPLPCRAQVHEDVRNGDFSTMYTRKRGQLLIGSSSHLHGLNFLKIISTIRGDLGDKHFMDCEKRFVVHITF